MLIKDMIKLIHSMGGSSLFIYKKLKSIIKRFKIKNMLCNFNFSKINEDLNVDGFAPSIHGKGKIIAGKNLSLRSFSIPIRLFADEKARIIIGDNVFIIMVLQLVHNKR